MTMEEVIENELKCVQRNCCRLENECAKCDLVLPIEEIINAYNETLKLKKETAELTCQMKRNTYCYSCTNATEKCYRKEIGCPCGDYKSYEDENAELKKRNGVLAGQKASLGRWLGEAIAVIKKFSEFLNSEVEYDPEHPQEHTDLWNELCERAERFLKEFTPPKS